jgi:hypothetical protein
VNWVVTQCGRRADHPLAMGRESRYSYDADRPTKLQRCTTDVDHTVRRAARRVLGLPMELIGRRDGGPILGRTLTREQGCQHL